MPSATPAISSPAAFGRNHFALAARLALVAWGFGGVLLVFLYARPTAAGTPFVLEWSQYFFFALLYDAAGTTLLSLPFLGTWLLLYTRPLEGARWLLLHAAHALVLTGALVLNHLDHEIYRFMGMRLTLALLQTYVHPHTSSQAIYDSLLEDRGGPFLSLALWIAVPALYAWWALRVVQGWVVQRRAWRLSRWAATAAVVLLLAVPFAVSRKTGYFRTQKTQPEIVALGLELWSERAATPSTPRDLDVLVREYQDRWLAESADRGWRFPRLDYPYLREPIDAGARWNDAGKPWNVIYLQLESFRGWNVGLLRPGSSPSPTPFIDALAAGEHSAYWDRFSSFGWPTINGAVSSHCSIAPHSRHFITTTFTNVELLSFPDALRRHGYRAEVFTVSDPDWDNQRVWMQRWYDRLWFYPEARQADRPAFHAAAARIRELGRSGRPFLATVVSFSNHNPFRSREPALDIAPVDSMSERVKNTMRYTDDVVRELLESLRGEPWFDRTLVILTGDHAYNLGEHDGQPTQPNFYRESLWVPLVIHGNHPRLPHGRQHDVSSLLDVAPTITDLLDIRERNPWMGHSLIAGPRPQATLLAMRNDETFAETPAFSLLTDQRIGARLYDAERDVLEQRDIAGRHPVVVRDLLQQAARARDLNDYLISVNRIWKR
jgi:hypothetical protein